MDFKQIYTGDERKDGGEAERTDGQTNGHTNGQTDRETDGQTLILDCKP